MAGMLGQIEATVKARVAKRDADRRAREAEEAQAQREREERERERRQLQAQPQSLPHLKFSIHPPLHPTLSNSLYFVYVLPH